MPISMISTNQHTSVMNVYVAEREGVNYTVYVRIQVYVQFVHLYSQKTFFLKTGGHLTGGLLVRGAIGQGADVRGGGGRLSRRQCLQMVKKHQANIG